MAKENNEKERGRWNKKVKRKWHGKIIRINEKGRGKGSRNKESRRHEKERKGEHKQRKKKEWKKGFMEKKGEEREKRTKNRWKC